MADMTTLTGQAAALLAAAHDQGVTDARAEKLTNSDYRRQLALGVIADQLDATARNWLSASDATAAGVLSACAVELRALAQTPLAVVPPPPVTTPPPKKAMVDAPVAEG
jgi:hypothetical protein